MSTAVVLTRAVDGADFLSDPTLRQIQAGIATTDTVVQISNV